MAEPEKHRLTPAERIFVRISVLQTVLALIGIFTGAVALFAALNEADAVRKQLYASVWPHLELGSDRWTKEAVARNAAFGGVEGPLFRYTVQNAGIGPARIRSALITVDGKAWRKWADVLQALLGKSDIPYGSSTLGGRVVRAGETINVMTLIGEPAELLKERLSSAADGSPRLAMTVCFCSVFDQCWIASDSNASNEPAPVAQCPEYATEGFLE